MGFVGRRLALIDPAEEIRQMFKAFDRSCRGFITRDDLRQVFSYHRAVNGYCTIEHLYMNERKRYQGIYLATFLAVCEI